MFCLYALSTNVLIFLIVSGKDATEAFEDVGHSDEARDILKTLYVGDFEGAPVSTIPRGSTRIQSSNFVFSRSSRHPKSTHPPHITSLRRLILAGTYLPSFIARISSLYLHSVIYLIA